MTVLITDPALEDDLKADRKARGVDQFDEVWEGMTVMSPAANNEHQDLAGEFFLVFRAVVGPPGAGRGRVFQVVNVSDREEGWLYNYREPDVAVFLAGTAARDCGTHWVGGPDFAVEILSPGDLAREKRGFYAQVGVLELLYVDRQPWALEMYRLQDGELRPVGISTPDRTEPLVSAVLPLSFRLVGGPGRPRIEIVRTDGDGHWAF
ncbi:MAG TPA: Uma2 family endonuclease [Isosphaeraceae bacterium]|jgi:Uma2 family endonuclease|nr:Uma2 family endonuclease [Isosphaeraceae bacterium]